MPVRYRGVNPDSSINWIGCDAASDDDMVKSNAPKRPSQRQPMTDGAITGGRLHARRREALSVAPEEAPRVTAAEEPDVRRFAAEVTRLEAELSVLRAKVRELELRADVDPLTEVLNRRGFERELKRVTAHVARYGGSAALVYLDLDGFKSVNDCHGHAAGDAVLKAVAIALSECVRTSDMVARLGGDEFAIVLWNVSERDALAKAVALENLVAARSFAWKGTALTIGASAGVAMLAQGEEPLAALARADGAMYTRKGARR